jgi:hypothetical protein
MAKKGLRILLAVAFMTCCSLSAIAQEVEEAIEHEGNKYTIHVEQLNPDSEMSLLDLLHICPELMSSDGKALTADYLLSVDDIMLSVDYEPLLEGIKACDLSEVTVCTYGAVNNAMDGTTGSIDLKFKEGKGLTGKVGLNGSTYGNGLLYADIAKEGENVTVRAFTQAHLKYGQVDALSGSSITSRKGVENAMLFVDWQMTENDLLKLKLSQGYDEHKDRENDGIIDDGEAELVRQRWGELVATYERTLNEQEAGLYVETGMNYSSNVLDQLGLQMVIPWWIVEFSVPFMNQSLWLTAGYEGDYTNLCYQGLRREQNLYSDLYVQLDYKKGPWVISVGDRFRHNNFWDKHYDEDIRQLWSYNRNDHGLHASVGFRKGRHFVQGIFSRSFFNPQVSDFHTYLENGPMEHTTDYKTILAWRSEARYTYQTKRLIAMGSVKHRLLTDMLLPDESLTSLETSVTWHQGGLRLTAGANVNYLHISYDDAITSTYYTLKLAPTLLFGKGFRLSSTLLYNSKIEAYDQHAHLYASVKIGKDLGKRCHLYADFHDIAGQQKGEAYFLRQSFKNRALTIGATYYPWR